MGNFFTICNCGFGIWVNFDAVLRFSFSTTCGIAVFGALTRPPLNKTIICSVVSLRTADAFPVVASLPSGNASAVRNLPLAKTEQNRLDKRKLNVLILLNTCG